MSYVYFIYTNTLTGLSVSDVVESFTREILNLARFFDDAMLMRKRKEIKKL